MEQTKSGQSKGDKNEEQVILRYCLYARKSSEDEDRQALSIDSQIKEMRQLAERDNLLIVTTRSEAHSAKNSGERKVFNKMMGELKSGEYNAILTWNADRLSRNAGDLGTLVDLMDKKQLLEIKTFNKTFTNSPNDKFLLMILGGEAKLENDNRGINVKRGLRAAVEKGLWPGVPPIGYKVSSQKHREGYIEIDPARGYMIKTIFEKTAEGWSQHRIRDWLTEELDFVSPNGKHLSLSTIQVILKRTLYYGEFEYPKNSGIWYKGVHQPLITKDLFDRATLETKKKRHLNRIYRKDFAYTKLIKCGLCGSSIIAEDKFKVLKDGSIAKYIYYGCDRAKDRHCKTRYMREEELIRQLCELVDQLTVDELGIKGQMNIDIDRMYRFHREVMGISDEHTDNELGDTDIKKYIKFLLKYGNIYEQRNILLNLKSNLILKDGKISIEKLHE